MRTARATNGLALGSDSGFTLLELLIVVLIIGVIVSIAIPVYADVQTSARRNSCFSNQRTIQGLVGVFLASEHEDVGDLAGVVDANHPLFVRGLLKSVPRCASAPIPPDIEAPDAEHGAYTLDLSGAVEPCPFAGHGQFGD